WPVKTPGDGVKKSWEVTEEEVLQIWAETLEYVKQGEKLYLEHDIDQLAKEEQRMAMESDEREGLVREYLETLLTDDWDDMELFVRSAFIYVYEFVDIPY